MRQSSSQFISSHMRVVSRFQQIRLIAFQLHQIWKIPSIPQYSRVFTIYLNVRITSTMVTAQKKQFHGRYLNYELNVFRNHLATVMLLLPDSPRGILLWIQMDPVLPTLAISIWESDLNNFNHRNEGFAQYNVIDRIWIFILRFGWLAWWLPAPFSRASFMDGVTSGPRDALL